MLKNGKYEEMHTLLTKESQEKTNKEDFISRNQNIYEGIDCQNLNIEITNIEEKDKTHTTLTYQTKMDTLAGEVSFSNTVDLTKDEEKKYKIEWGSYLIFPQLRETDKVRVNKIESKRGTLVDRDGTILAQDGVVSSVGLVPGRMAENKEEDIAKIAELLDLSKESIENDLKASYVKEDTFVPIKKVAKNATALKEKLLEIKGIKIVEDEARVYPLGVEAAHITGYVQSINAEELKELAGKGYTTNSVLGRTGLEKVYEDRLKGTDGCEIYIVGEDGNKKNTIATQDAKDGETIKLTIDASMQKELYHKLEKDKGLAVVMDSKTGEVLALVSTPSFDANDFVLGMSNDKWNSLLENKANPLNSRYQASWCPGSTFKSITGAVGITAQKLDPKEDFGTSGLSWKKDESWGDYRVTTLTPYSGAANLQNALIHSDNIYFAKAALKIGKDSFKEGLQKLGLNKEAIPFAQAMSKSQFSNSDTFSSEIQLADSGYGQGEILVNPLHMASMYSSFVNEGNMLKPYLEYKEEVKAEYYKENVFTKEAAEMILEDLVQVVENPEGTAHSAKMKNVKIAAKTGTAEIKGSKEEEGTQLGWFNAITADPSYEKQLVVISMIENAENYSGGSHYLFPIVTGLF